MCRAKSRQPSQEPALDESESAVFDSICSVRSFSIPSRSSQELTLDHHLYNKLANSWTKQKSRPQPFRNLLVKALPEDFEHFAF